MITLQSFSFITLHFSLFCVTLQRIYEESDNYHSRLAACGGLRTELRRDQAYSQCESSRGYAQGFGSAESGCAAYVGLSSFVCC